MVVEPRFLIDVATEGYLGTGLKIPSITMTCFNVSAYGSAGRYSVRPLIARQLKSMIVRSKDLFDLGRTHFFRFEMNGKQAAAAARGKGCKYFKRTDLYRRLNEGPHHVVKKTGRGRKAYDDSRPLSTSRFCFLNHFPQKRFMRVAYAR